MYSEHLRAYSLQELEAIGEVLQEIRPTVKRFAGLHHELHRI